MSGINTHGVWAIYRFEMARALRTVWQSLVTPVITTTLYLAVFGTALNRQMQAYDGVTAGSFIVPGLIMLSLLTQSVSNASIGIYFPKFTGTVFELLSAPITAMEMVVGFVGAAATKSVFVPLRIDHPLAMLAMLMVTSLAFSLAGFIIGIWANGFEQLSFVPALIITPLTFLGGTFYPVSSLPEPWHTISLFNPVVYLISGFRWTFFGKGDVNIAVSLGVTAFFLLLCLGIVAWIFRTGWRLKN